jgi:hypothetical protein
MSLIENRCLNEILVIRPNYGDKITEYHHFYKFDDWKILLDKYNIQLKIIECGDLFNYDQWLYGLKHVSTDMDYVILGSQNYYLQNIKEVINIYKQRIPKNIGYLLNPWEKHGIMSYNSISLLNPINEKMNDVFDPRTKFDNMIKKYMDIQYIKNTIWDNCNRDYVFDWKILMTPVRTIVDIPLYDFTQFFKDKLHNKHKGERVFLIGSGNTLNIFDTDMILLPTDKIVSVNKSFLRNDYLTKNTDYIVCEHLDYGNISPNEPS